jgi:hypothetical protein
LRHQRDLFRMLVGVHRTRRALPPLSALPVRLRVLELMTGLFFVADGLRADLEHEDAAAVREIMPEVDRVIEAIDALMNRMAS